MRQNPWMDDTFSSSSRPAGQPRPTAQKVQGRAVAPFTPESSEFSIPDSELEDSAEARVPDSPSPRLIPMPADKILFPRRMIYIEAGLYLAIAAAAFGMGYLIGRGGTSRPVASEADPVVENRVPLDGRITFSSRESAPQADAGAVVIVLPNDKSPDKPLPATGFRPDDPPAGPSDPGVSALAALGGAMTRTGEDGRFALVVPRPGLYHILIISRHSTRNSGEVLERQHLKELANYFDAPEDVLRRFRYEWIQCKVQSGMAPIDRDFKASD